MRRRKSDLHARVNRNLPLEFDDVRLTSYAGLELLERYRRTRRFNQLVREAFADLPRGGDFGVVVMVRVFVGLVIVGGRRLRHLASVADDPIFQRFGNVRVVPTAWTLSRWLRHFTMRTVTRFQALNAAVVRQLLPTLGLRTWTVDVDGVVVSTGLQVERAARGYNPHQRKVPSYDPIMAHLAETTHILRVKKLGAFVLDLVIPVAAFILIVAVAEIGSATETEAGAGIGAIIGLLLFFAYIIWALVLFARGTTPGKKVLRMRVIKEDGTPAGFITMLLREWIGKWISGLILSLDFLWILFDKDNQGWHDKLMSTYVTT